MNFIDFSSKYKPEIEKQLSLIFAEYDDGIFSMMKYGLLSKGKRIRPLLTLLSFWQSGKKIDDELIKASLIAEIIHSYSLIHDDLPEMDNDSTRRGEETVWKKFGSGNAVLAGDGLLTFAFNFLSELNIPDETKIKLVYSLSLAAGPSNMIRGQQYDLFSAEKIKNIDDLEFMYLMKTGALMTYSTTAGGILSGADEETIRAFNVFGANFGIAFQLRDDLDDAKQISDQDKNTSLKFKSSTEVEELILDHKKMAMSAIDSIENADNKVWSDVLDLI